MLGHLHPLLPLKVVVAGGLAHVCFLLGIAPAAGERGGDEGA